MFVGVEPVGPSKSEVEICERMVGVKIVGTVSSGDRWIGEGRRKVRMEGECTSSLCFERSIFLLNMKCSKRALSGSKMSGMVVDRTFTKL